MKRNTYTYALLITMLCALSSCKVTQHEILLGDVISFGNDAKTSFEYLERGSQTDPYVLYSGENHSVNRNNMFRIIQRIKNTEMENNTAGIYAMDLALDRIRYIRNNQLKNDPNARYYIIYMTDGLDNISCEVARNNQHGRYATPEKYKEKIKKEIADISGYKKKTQNPFEIYPVVFTGSDLDAVKRDNNLTEEEFNDFIEEKMGWLRGSSRGPENASPIIADADFDIILERFMEEFHASGFEFHVPKGYVGNTIIMKFEDENHQQTELIGKFVKKCNKYYLRDVQLRGGLEIGVKPKNGNPLELTAINNKDKESELAKFRLEKPRCNDKTYFIVNNKENDDKEYVQQYVQQYVNGNEIRVKNSEYVSQSKGSIDTYFILVFDSSKSLKSEMFEKEKETAIEMIKVIMQGVLDAEQKVDVIENIK